MTHDECCASLLLMGFKKISYDASTLWRIKDIGVFIAEGTEFKNDKPFINITGAISTNPIINSTLNSYSKLIETLCALDI